MTHHPSTHVYATHAQLGESLRLSGNYSSAIYSFTEAIEDYKKRPGISPAAEGKDLDPSCYYWAYAHRGAARGQLGDFTRGLKDFRTAHPYYLASNSAVWFYAQLGEFCRLWSRALRTTNSESVTKLSLTDPDRAFLKIVVSGNSKQGSTPQGEGSHAHPRVHHDNLSSWLELLHSSVSLFNVALSIESSGSDDPWVYGHRGAAYAQLFVAGQKPKTHEELSGDYADAAIQDFKRACKANPGYSWAYAFHGLVLGMRGDKESAIALLGQANLSGMDRQLTFLRSLILLWGSPPASPNPQESPAEDKTTETQKYLAQAVQKSWDLLQIDGDETYARYFVATSLKSNQLLRTGASGKLQHSIFEQTSEAAILRAWVSVTDMKAKVMAMEGGLACLERNFTKASESLAAILKLYEHNGLADIDVVGMLRFDTAWSEVRKPAKDLGNSALDKAHSLYRQIVTVYEPTP